MGQTAIYAYFLTYGSLLGAFFLFLAGLCWRWWKKRGTLVACDHDSIFLPYVFALGFLYFLVVVGSEFDGWWHAAVGRDNFWIAPHLVILISNACLTIILFVLARKRQLQGTRSLFFVKSALLFEVGLHVGMALDNTAHNLFGQENISTPLVSLAPPHIFIGLCLVAIGFFLVRLVEDICRKEPERFFLTVLIGGSMIGFAVYQYQPFWPLGIYRVSEAFGQFVIMAIIAAIFSLLWRRERFLFAGFALSLVIVVLEAMRMSGGGIGASVPYPFVPFRIPSIFLYSSFLASGLAIDIFRILRSRVSERNTAIAGVVYGFTHALFYYIPAKWWIGHTYPHAHFLWTEVCFIIVFGVFGAVFGFLIPWWSALFFSSRPAGGHSKRTSGLLNTDSWFCAVYRRIKWRFLFVSMALIGVVGFTVSALHVKWTGVADICQKETSKDVYLCYKDITNEMLQKEGAVTVLQYAKDVIIKKTNYNVAHLIMHVIGRGVYEKTHDIRQALAYLPPDAHIYSYYYDGYRHGLFQAYFKDHHDQDVAGLIQSVCAEGDDGILASSKHVGEKMETENCFHAIGHALMYMHANDVMKSVSDCDKILGDTGRYWCLYGVFMEYSYRFSPFYAQEEGGQISDTSLLSLCSRVNMEQRVVCTQFVGRAFLTKNHGDVEGAFGQCKLLEEAYRFPCIRQASRIFIPSLFQNDVPKMIDVCIRAGEAYQEACARGVALGIDQGIAGFDALTKKELFCRLAEARFRIDCKGD